MHPQMIAKSYQLREPFLKVQWNVITLVQHLTENISRIITITKCDVYWDLKKSKIASSRALVVKAVKGEKIGEL